MVYMGWYYENILIQDKLIINDMKKYSSYANLKISPTPKSYPIDYWPTKITTTPSTRKVVETPLMIITKQPYGVPITTKYSAGYLQRQKMFSNKKENKDSTNVHVRVNGGNGSGSGSGGNVGVGSPVHGNGGYDSKGLLFNRPASSKSKKNQDKERSVKKDKPIKSQKYLELENKENNCDKQLRYQVQSPKGNVNKTHEFKQKQKSKPKIQQKQKQKTHQKSGITINNIKPKQKKQQQKLNEYVTKYEPEPKSILLHCTSQSNLIKTINLQQKKCPKGYYKSVVHNAFFGTKTSSFHQICRNHLVTSIQFLTYAKRNKHIIPQSVQKLSLPPTTRKTIIFDLDQTLIHCNQSLEKPHDVALEITFPNNSKIKAGINVRPYAVDCLRELSKYFQLIVFTASHQCYANVIVDYLDPQGEFISHRFFRETCHRTEQGFYVKDLRVFNRDPCNMLLVDNAAYSYCFQPQNGVPIIPFYNNKADLQLKEVTNYLKQFIECKNMRLKNENYMRLSDYCHYTCPKQLVNQLYS